MKIHKEIENMTDEEFNEFMSQAKKEPYTGINNPPRQQKENMKIITSKEIQRIKPLA